MTPPAWTARWTATGTYAHDGAGPEVWNCYNLMAAVQRRQFGLAVPVWAGEIPDPRTMAAELWRCAAAQLLSGRDLWREVETPKPGDGIAIRIGGLEVHCAVVVAIRPENARAGLMMHVHDGINVTVEAWHGMRWKNRIGGFYRFIGGEDG